MKRNKWIIAVTISGKPPFGMHEWIVVKVMLPWRAWSSISGLNQTFFARIYTARGLHLPSLHTFAKQKYAHILQVQVQVLHFIGRRFLPFLAWRSQRYQGSNPCYRAFEDLKPLRRKRLINLSRPKCCMENNKVKRTVRMSVTREN